MTRSVVINVKSYFKIIQAKTIILNHPSAYLHQNSNNKIENLFKRVAVIFVN